MPELPEVETVARGVDERLRGDRIVEAWFGGHKEPFKNSPAAQAQVLENRVILNVQRVGKHIVVRLGDKSDNSVVADHVVAEWIVHLGMTGRLLVTTPNA